MTAIVVTGVVLVVALAAVAEACRRARMRLRFVTDPESSLLGEHLSTQDTEIRLGPDELGYLRGTTVLVAGAGSSIAAELIRRLTTADVRRIVLLDNHENALYRLRQGFLQTDPSSAGLLRIELANIRDRVRLTEVFERHRPDVVFHFANYKSASLGNISPYAFVKVNVEGTRNLLHAATATPAVRRFVYVSSDKAHTATQTYGRTKLLGEMLTVAHARRHPGVRFSCIRYCNVLDAAGSFAIPTFRDQIATGRKVTVRRFADGGLPDRFFIPLEVAAGLTLYAGSVARSGTVLSLDSARVRPLRIDDLVRILARRWGVRHVSGWMARNVDFVDAEPGEKRSEVLGTGRPVEGAPLVELAGPRIDDPERFDADVADLVARTPHLGADELHERVRVLVEDGRYAVADVPEPRSRLVTATDGPGVSGDAR